MPEPAPNTNTFLKWFNALINLGIFTTMILMDVYCCAYFISYLQRVQVFKRLIIMMWLLLMTVLTFRKPKVIADAFPVCENSVSRHLIMAIVYITFMFFLLADPLFTSLNDGTTELDDLKGDNPFAVPINPKMFFRGIIGVISVLGASCLVNVIGAMVIIWSKLLAKKKEAKNTPVEEEVPAPQTEGNGGES